MLIALVHLDEVDVCNLCPFPCPHFSNLFLSLKCSAMPKLACVVSCSSFFLIRVLSTGICRTWRGSVSLLSDVTWLWVSSIWEFSVNICMNLVCVRPELVLVIVFIESSCFVIIRIIRFSVSLR